MEAKHSQVEWFIRQVAEGTSGLDANVIRDMSHQLKLSLFEYPCFCLAVRFRENATGDAAAPMLLMSACRQAQKQCAAESFCYIGNQFRLVMVVAAPDGHRTEIVEKLYKAIEKHTAGQIQIGVGRSYGELEKLSYSRVEAYEALSGISPGGKISYIDDIYVKRSSTTRKLESEKRKVIELFKSGQLELMMESMVLLAENIRKESPAREGMPYPTSIRRTILEVLLEIMHISSDAGVDVEAVLNYQDPYNRVFQFDDTPEILAWVHELAEILYQSAAELSSRSEKNMLTLAKSFIDAHLDDPELSLSLISEKLGITPTYFSSFFIHEMGTGFQEYVTGHRLEKAKRLLTGTAMKVNQIAQACGFRSASYFTNVFRKQMGISPGEYRNMK